jgi:hypothetical protein
MLIVLERGEEVAIHRHLIIWINASHLSLSASRHSGSKGTYFDSFRELKRRGSLNLKHRVERNDKLDTLPLMLRLENDFLNRPDPFVTCGLGIGGERVLALGCPQLQPCVVNRLAARSVLK